mmetsp:Transcript_62150/g.148142  ORF Transcript_62150/g.148142 Transcript_62150/m.148142 type:complete len:372 (-) Transcript_62150:436-1551(-)
MVADSTHHILCQRLQAAEERMGGEDRHVPLEMKVSDQCVGGHVQQLHLALRHPLLLVLKGQQNAPLDPHSEAGRDLVVIHELLQSRQLGVPLYREQVQLCHRGGEATDDCRGQEEARIERNHVQHPLIEADGINLHGSAELSHSPMKRDEVDVHHICILVLEVHQPVLIAITVGSHAKPDASQHMAIYNHTCHDLQDAQHRGEGAGPEDHRKAAQHLRHPREAHQPDQPCHLDEAQHLHRLPEPRSIKTLQIHEVEPVKANHGEIDHEPGLQVMHRRARRQHLKGAIRAGIARQKVDEDVHSPKDARRPVDDLPSSSWILCQQQLQWNKNCIACDEKCAKHVPADSAPRSRGHHEARQASREEAHLFLAFV